MTNESKPTSVIEELVKVSIVHLHTDSELATIHHPAEPVVTLLLPASRSVHQLGTFIGRT